MHWYKIIESSRGPLIQVLYGGNIIDECGPWETLVSAINWAEQYVTSRNQGQSEPQIN
jgi:hypothetical protein